MQIQFIFSKRREEAAMISSYSFRTGKFMVLVLLMITTTSHGKFLNRRLLGNTGSKSEASMEFTVYIINQQGRDVSAVCTADHYKTTDLYLLDEYYMHGLTFPETDDFFCDMCWLDESNKQFGFGHFHLYSAFSLPPSYRSGDAGNQYCTWLLKDNRLHIKNFVSGKYEERLKGLNISVNEFYKKLGHHYRVATACRQLYHHY